jgi:molybdate transport system substrate-binding protein
MNLRRKISVLKRGRGVRYQVLLLCVLMSGSITGCTREQEQIELMVGAAASLEPVLKEIKAAYSEQNPDIKISFTFAGSGTLEQQIREGAPIDIFLSASQKQVASLEEDGLILNNSKVDLLQNELALIVPKDNKTKITGFENVNIATVIAMGDPDSVPAGQYAMEVFESLDNWSEIKEKATYGKDVSEVLAWVSAGNADVGVVYITDAMKEDAVEIVGTAPEGSHSSIIYPAAILAETELETQAKDFIRFLSSTEAKGIFEEYGFRTAK